MHSLPIVVKKCTSYFQIVKPLEGSLTLATWSQLATPTLGGLLEERPGVKIRGGRQLEDLGLELYSLSDLEEDDENVNPGKSFQSTGSVYTYTNSTVLHPDDNTSVTARSELKQIASVQKSFPNVPCCSFTHSLTHSLTHSPPPPLPSPSSSSLRIIPVGPIVRHNWMDHHFSSLLISGPIIKYPHGKLCNFLFSIISK
jgi:hypothetical protein